MLAGGPVRMTIHPRIQASLDAAERQGGIERRPRVEEPVDPQVVVRAASALPEFERAYRDDGLDVTEFDGYEGVQLVLRAFDETGWQKLKSLEVPRRARSRDA